ncbi:hypothetical protein C8R47DRAFT_1221153 [Mycena vitilis]|nr:hypothetical protein C8R47DRAFT_1221153 [Mycena vitilis]
MALVRPSSPSSASASTRAPPFSLLEFGNLVSAALDSPDPLLLSPFLSGPAHHSIDSNAHDEQKRGVRTLLKKFTKRASAFVRRSSASPTTTRPSSPEYRIPELRLASASSSASLYTAADADAFVPYLPLVAQYERASPRAHAFSRSTPSLPSQYAAHRPNRALSTRASTASFSHAVSSPSSTSSCSSTSTSSTTSSSFSSSSSSSSSAYPPTPLALSTVSESFESEEGPTQWSGSSEDLTLSLDVDVAGEEGEEDPFYKPRLQILPLSTPLLLPSSKRTLRRTHTHTRTRRIPGSPPRPPPARPIPAPPLPSLPARGLKYTSYTAHPYLLAAPRPETPSSPSPLPPPSSLCKSAAPASPTPAPKLRRASEATTASASSAEGKSLLDALDAFPAPPALGLSASFPFPPPSLALRRVPTPPTPPRRRASPTTPREDWLELDASPRSTTSVSTAGGSEEAWHSCSSACSGSV